jgi:dTDP-glucose pyrophosphorylase
MQVVIPMAGRGSRFLMEGFTPPKPLIDVGGLPMIVRAIKSLEGLSISKLIIVTLKEHEHQYGVSEILQRHIPNQFELVILNDVTEGQLCTVLEAKHLLDLKEDLLIAACDTYVEEGITEDVLNSKYHGIISVANLEGEQWSFARLGDDGCVVEVAEKKRISDNASTGLYYFRNVQEFINYGELIIANQERTRGEFYIMPVYQKMIEAGFKVGISRAKSMWDMGTPVAKVNFENYLKSIL